jgi:hypothetical protein
VPKTRLHPRSKLAPENLKALKHAQTKFINHIEAVRNHQQTLQPSQRILPQAFSDGHSYGATDGDLNSVILATTPDDETQREFRPPTRSDTRDFFEKAMEELNGDYASQHSYSDFGLPQSSPNSHLVSIRDDNLSQGQSLPLPGSLEYDMQGW